MTQWNRDVARVLNRARMAAEAAGARAQAAEKAWHDAIGELGPDSSGAVTLGHTYSEAATDAMGSWGDLEVLLEEREEWKRAGSNDSAQARVRYLYPCGLLPRVMSLRAKAEGR